MTTVEQEVQDVQVALSEKMYARIHYEYIRNHRQQY